MERYSFHLFFDCGPGVTKQGHSCAHSNLYVKRAGNFLSRLFIAAPRRHVMSPVTNLQNSSPLRNASLAMTDSASPQRSFWHSGRRRLAPCAVCPSWALIFRSSCRKNHWSRSQPCRPTKRRSTRLTCAFVLSKNKCVRSPRCLD